MKKLIFLPVFLIIALKAEAQRPQTLIDNDFGNTSGFGGFMISIQNIDGSLSSMTGGGGAVILDNTFFFGGYGLGLADDKEITFEDTEFDVDFGHGGFYLGYVIRPTDLVHFGISSKLGWGEISFREKEPFINQTRINDRVFVVLPQAEVEVNMTNWFKFNVGVGYQSTIGVDNFYYNERDFDGLAVGISFLFGWFN